MDKLKKIHDMMRQLRDQKQGCNWCRQQTFETLLPNTLEEVYELSEAVHDQESKAIQEELSDLLFHLLFYAQIAEEQGQFNLEDIMQSFIDKAYRRNPHIFVDKKSLNFQDTVKQWEKIKHTERQRNKTNNLLDKIPSALPALTRAQKLQQRASRVGFDWEHTEPVFDKLAEEIMELKHACDEKASPEKLAEELGDVLFCCVNLARHLAIDPEVALQQANNKFTKRFQFIEEKLKQENKTFETMTLKELDQCWAQAKQKEASS